jgi:multimeric flavodoxin WrbA
MADGLETGAYDVAKAMEMPLEVKRVRAKDATATDVKTSDGFLFCAPENLAPVSGEMKEFFDRTYYDMFDIVGECGISGYEEVPILVGRPYGLAIAAGSDGFGASRQVERNGLPQTLTNILAEKPRCSEEALERCREMGGVVAATLLL